MIEKVRWYLDCYRMYFKINLLTVLEYKLDFLAINLASVLALLVGVFNIEIIFSQVDAMKMWSKEEVLWCLGFFYLVRAIYNTFFINTLSISYWIQNGKFDLFILKPLNTFFQLLSTGRYNAEYPLDEYLVGIFLLIRTSHKLHMFHGWQSIVLFVFLLVTAVFAYFSIIFIMSTLSFWFIKSNMFITSGAADRISDRHLPCRDPGSRQCADSDRSGELLSDSLHAGSGQQRDFAIYSRCLCHIGCH